MVGSGPHSWGAWVTTILWISNQLLLFNSLWPQASTRIQLFPQPGGSVAKSHSWVPWYLHKSGYVAPLQLLLPLAGKETQKLCLPLSKSFFHAWLTPLSLLLIVVSLNWGNVSTAYQLWALVSAHFKTSFVVL